MKILFVAIITLSLQFAAASGLMLRPPKIDICKVDPESEKCKKLSKRKSESATEAEDTVEVDGEEPLQRPKVKRRVRRRKRVHPCRIDPEGEACANWKIQYQKLKKRRRMNKKVLPDEMGSI